MGFVIEGIKWVIMIGSGVLGGLFGGKTAKPSPEEMAEKILPYLMPQIVMTSVITVICILLVVWVMKMLFNDIIKDKKEVITIVAKERIEKPLDDVDFRLGKKSNNKLPLQNNKVINLKK